MAYKIITYKKLVHHSSLQLNNDTQSIKIKTFAINLHVYQFETYWDINLHFAF